MKMNVITADICNTYGSLHIGECEGKYYWIVEDYDGIDDIDRWEEIPELMYNVIKAHIFNTKK